jgi:phosphoenolpyruvate carboxylase
MSELNVNDFYDYINEIMNLTKRYNNELKDKEIEFMPKSVDDVKMFATGEWMNDYQNGGGKITMSILVELLQNVTKYN